MQYVIVSLVVSLVVLLFETFAMGLVFAKAGEKIWKSFIPFYRYYILGKITEHSILGLVLAILAVFSSIASGVTSYNNFEIARARAQIRAESKSGYTYVTDENGNQKAINVPKKPTFSNQNRVESLSRQNSSYMSMSIILGLATYVITVILYYSLCSHFNKGIGFFLGLLFFNSIFIPILAFDSSEYQSTRYRY